MTTDEKMAGKLRYIALVFEENEIARTHEIVSHWSVDGGSTVKEIVRQRWNFSPPKSIPEVEEYRIDLPGRHRT
jgi:hypothetical protein